MLYVDADLDGNEEIKRFTTDFIINMGQTPNFMVFKTPTLCFDINCRK